MTGTVINPAMIHAYVAIERGSLTPQVIRALRANRWIEWDVLGQRTYLTRTFVCVSMTLPREYVPRMRQVLGVGTAPSATARVLIAFAPDGRRVGGELNRAEWNALRPRLRNRLPNGTIVETDPLPTRAYEQLTAVSGWGSHDPARAEP